MPRTPISSIEPGQFVRHPERPDWGLGQVQSALGDRVTVNFENAGKVLVNTADHLAGVVRRILPVEAGMTLEAPHGMAQLSLHARVSSPMIDPFGRSITYIRVSVTDRCDLRCVYCMAEDMTFLPKA